MERVYHFPGTGYTSGISVATPLVKGLQGNVWTERIHTSERLQFMVYPRLSALAEAAWTQDRSKKLRELQFADGQDDGNLQKKSGIVFFDYKNPIQVLKLTGPEMRKKIEEMESNQTNHDA